MTIVLSNSAVQTIPAGGTVTFDYPILQSGAGKDNCNGSEYHRQGSNSVALRWKGGCAPCPQPNLFDVSFNGNVTSTEADTQVQLAIELNGSPIYETLMQQTVSTANDYVNLGARTYVKLCPYETVTLTVTNTGTTPLILNTGSAFTVRRVA